MKSKALGLSIMAIFLASAFGVSPLNAGADEWSEPIAVGEQPSGYSYNPVIASNSLGWQITGWVSWEDDAEQVYVNRYDPDTGWSGSERIGYGTCVEVGIDDNCNSTVAWVNDSSVLATRYIPAYGEWDEIAPIFEGDSRVFCLSISVCDDGCAAATWVDLDYDIYGSIRGSGPFWGPAELISQVSDWMYDIEVAMDDDHNAIAVWTMDGDVWANRYVNGEGWGTPIVIESQDTYSFDARLDINSDGIAIAAWTSQPGGVNLVFASVYTPGIGWGVETPIDDPAMGYSETPDVAIDDAGNAVAVWRLVALDYSYTCTRASIFDPDSGWGQSATIQENPGGFMHRACIGDDGDSYVSLLRYNETWDSYVLAASRHTQADGWEGESVITTISNISGFAMTADVLRNATVVWCGVYDDNDTWGVYVSDYFGTPSDTEDPVVVTGSMTVSPGETEYLSYGACGVGDLLFWSIEISTQSSTFEYWLQTPTGMHLPLESLVWSYEVDRSGEWKLGFGIESGEWDATVNYTICHSIPYVEITAPTDSSYVNDPVITVAGIVDLFATEVELSYDHLHYWDAYLHEGNWSKVFTLPSDGEYTIYAEGTVIWCGVHSVKYYDQVEVTLDRVPPSVDILAPANGSYIAGALDLTWESSDNCGILLTEVRIDESDWVTVDSSEFSCDPSDGEHLLEVRVTDVAGNSAMTSVTVTSDTTPPELDITSPNDQSMVVGFVDVTWESSDNFAVALTEVRVDDTEWVDVEGCEYSCILPDGEHILRVRITDVAGNTAEASVNVTSDTVSPALTILSPLNNSYLMGEIHVSWQCSDENSIDLTEVRVDGLDWTLVDGNEYSCDVSDGTHTVMVRVTDPAGNSAVASAIVVSDTLPPVLTIATPKTGSKITEDSVTITWIGSDDTSGIDHYEVMIGGDWIDVGAATSYTFTNLDDEWYNVKVRAVDRSGNVEESSIDFGVYTSIWSTDGPYHGIPLYAVIAGAAALAVLSVLLYRRMRGPRSGPHPEDHQSDQP